MHMRQFVESECYVSPQEHRWEEWFTNLEDILGRAIDPLSDEAELAHDAFLALATPAQYAAELRGAA